MSETVDGVAPADDMTRRVVELRLQGYNTAQIAETLDRSQVFVAKRLVTARKAGLLDDEPRYVIGRDGKEHLTRHKVLPRTSVDATNRPRRPRRPLLGSWRNRVADLQRHVKALQRMREDDRYRTTLHELAHTTRADIETLHTLLGDILQDFSELRES